MRHRGGAPGRAARELAKWAGESRPKKARTISDAAFVKVLEEASSMLATNSFEKAQGKHFVAIYADLHFRVYGVAPGDLGARERTFAAKLAGNMLAKYFDGDRSRFACFVAWTWSREREREKWRRENGRDGSRIDWRLQFNPKLLTDFRISEERKKAS